METQMFLYFNLLLQTGNTLSESADCREQTFCWHSNPVQVASELLGDVRLSSGW